MSYILDAIKKSDREYQLQQGQGSAQFHYARPEVAAARSPVLWLLALCVMLLLLLSSVAYYLVNSGVVAVRMPSITLSEPPVDARQAPAPVVLPAQSPPADDAHSLSRQQADAPGLGLPVQQAPLALMPTALRDRLGPLHFSLHVYSSQPEQRSIIINNRMMREGEWLTPQLLLHAITQEGVIMSADGAHYRVPVVNDWQ